MTSSNDKSTSFRWELKTFRSQINNNNKKDVTSGSFNMGSVGFILFYHNSGEDWPLDNYGIVLKNLDNRKSVEVNLKLWFEDEYGQKFYEHSIEKHTFNKSKDCYKFYVQDSGNDWKLFWNAYCDYLDLYICCELTDLNNQTIVSKSTVSKTIAPKTDRTQQFLLNMWSMFEQEKYDAVIKVSKTEFKIFKFPFMAQSEVFDQMFNSAFKESKTNIVNVKDVSEKAMQQLIKWVYTCQIEDESVVEELFETADKYAIKLLKEFCVEIMINSFDNSNAFRRLILAIAHNDNYLKDCALKYIDKMLNMEMVAYLTSSEWIELAHKKPIFAKEVNKLICDKLKK